MLGALFSTPGDVCIIVAERERKREEERERKREKDRDRESRERERNGVPTSGYLTKLHMVFPFHEFLDINTTFYLQIILLQENGWTLG